MKFRVGIFFGGASREREISFSGGRTVFDNLNRELFEPIPIFVDSLGNLILLKWKYLYKGTIRDFYPVPELLSEEQKFYQIYVESLEDNEPIEKHIERIGRRISYDELPELIDFAYLVLHGPFGEDGTLQGMLEFMGIPYSNSGIFPSSLAVDKTKVKTQFSYAGLTVGDSIIVSREDWISKSDDIIREKVVKFFDAYQRIVVKPANQGSSIGVSFVEKIDLLKEAVDKAFFLKRLNFSQWREWSESDKRQFIRSLVDPRYSIGFPVVIYDSSGQTISGIIKSPVQLRKFLDSNENFPETIILAGFPIETEVIIEKALDGKEFSCIVIENQRFQPVALLPTEIIKSGKVFDYRSKYLAGMARKRTPARLPVSEINKIRETSHQAYVVIKCNVYARIDGFLTKEGHVIINDPNTTSGMLPSSLLFHQTALIGMGPSEFLTYSISHSLCHRRNSATATNKAFEADEKLSKIHKVTQDKKKDKVAVIMGGYSSERHISVESGRNIFEKLLASEYYEPIPFFLTRGDNGNLELYRIPLHLLYKDNADDIAEEIKNYEHHELIDEIKEDLSDVIKQYANKYAVEKPELVSWEELSQLVDFVFIALHGRPGEDGTIQKILEKLGLPYNGSGIRSSEITIDKHLTNKVLRQNGFYVQKQKVVHKPEWKNNKEFVISQIEEEFAYPFIAKPVDEGCSSAVIVIKNRKQLEAYAETTFRNSDEIDEKNAKILNLPPNALFPPKDTFLIEELVRKPDGGKLFEITVGLTTETDPKTGEIRYRVFVPSLVPTKGEILTLEEKFLAGEGQNITPAVFVDDIRQNEAIIRAIQKEIERLARVLDIHGYARVDAFLRLHSDGTPEVVIIEVNSLPGMTPATVIFHQAAEEGMTPIRFIEHIIEEGKRKHKLKTAKVS